MPDDLGQDSDLAVHKNNDQIVDLQEMHSQVADRLWHTFGYTPHTGIVLTLDNPTNQTILKRLLEARGEMESADIEAYIEMCTNGIIPAS